MDRLRAAASLFSFRPFDPGTEEGRSKERYRRAALGTAAAFAARSVQMITSIVSVPLTFHYLGPERNGLWVVISSTITMFSFADLGIGNGLLNAIAGAHGRGDRTSAAHYVSSAFFALIAVAALVATAFAGCYAFVPWPSVFNVSTAQAAAEAGPSVAVFVASFSVSMPLGVVQRVRMGYQEGFVDSLWTTIGGLAAFVSVLMAIRWQLSLPWLVFAMAGVPAVVQMNTTPPVPTTTSPRANVPDDGAVLPVTPPTYRTWVVAPVKPVVTDAVPVIVDDAAIVVTLVNAPVMDAPPVVTVNPAATVNTPALVRLAMVLDAAAF